MLASRIGKHATVQNKSTPTGPYEDKVKSYSRVHKVNCDYQSLVIPDLCNPRVITKVLVL